MRTLVLSDTAYFTGEETRQKGRLSDPAAGTDLDGRLQGPVPDGKASGHSQHRVCST